MSEERIVRNSITTPDGTVLHSRNRHDYRTHRDSNGLLYMVDGGNDYLRRTLHPDHPHVETSLYMTDPHEVLREGVTWGALNEDKTGYNYVKIKNMSKAHINNIISDGYRGALVEIMMKELKWRKSHESKSEAKRMEVQREASYG